MMILDRTSLLLVFAAFLASAAPILAQQAEAAEPVEMATEEAAARSILDQWRASPTTIFDSIDVELGDFQFVARPLVVFADSPADPMFIQQMELLMADPEALRVRDVIVITDMDPAARSSVRQELRPRGFSMVLIDKDGRVGQRKPSPFSVRELSRAIDKMPIRLQEIRDGAG
jgi:hypothetical protein